MASDQGGNKSGNSSEFNKKNSHARSDYQTLTGGYLKNATSNKVKNNLHQVQETYHKKKDKFLLKQKVDREVYLKGKPQNALTPGKLNKNKKLTKEEIQKFDKNQLQSRQNFEGKWNNKAKLASEGKEWRDEKIKKNQAAKKVEERRKVTAKFNKKKTTTQTEVKKAEPTKKVSTNPQQTNEKQKRVEALKAKFKQQSQRSNTTRTFNKDAKKR